MKLQKSLVIWGKRQSPRNILIDIYNYVVLTIYFKMFIFHWC
jgi:hypothetical protein